MKSYKCLYCNKEYVNKESLYSHIEKHHMSMIPKGIPVSQHLFNIRNNKTHGTCIICGNETKWNNKTEKYERICSENCKEQYREMFKKRMINKHGVETLLNQPEHQRKMLANRRISGEYVWSDGKKLTYTGSYEKDFLQFLDKVMNFSSNDVMSPSPHTFYYTSTDGVERFYIPDIYIVSLNVLIEIKDGGDNPNNHPKFKAVDKQKEKLKDEVMKKQKKFNYLKLTNKDYSLFFKFLQTMKERNGEEKLSVPIISIAESFNLLNKYEKTLSKKFNLSEELINIDKTFIQLMENIDLDAKLSMNHITDKSKIVLTENLSFEEYGLPSIKKFPINNVPNLRRTIKSFKLCEKTKRKELARNIVLASDRLNYSLSENHILWNYVENKQELLQESKIKDRYYHEVDRRIEYNYIPVILEISKLIDNSPNIYLSSDYHLWNTKRKVLKDLKQTNHKINDMILQNHNRIVKDDDLFIFLGDLVNDEFDDKDSLKSFIQKLKGQKILVLGNNDCFDVEFYNECGFRYVVESFKHNNIYFTHYPVQTNNDEYNIHGHIHFSKQYFDIEYKNHIDVCVDAHSFKPIELKEALRLQSIGYYDGTTITNGDFRLYNNLHNESCYHQTNEQTKKETKLFNLINQSLNCDIDIPKFTKDDEGFYACNYGNAYIEDLCENLPIYIIGYNGESYRDIPVNIIGLIDRGTEQVLIGQYSFNNKEYTEFEIMNLIYMQERKYENSNCYLYNKHTKLTHMINLSRPEFDIEEDEFINNISESFEIDTDGNVLIKLREKSNFMEKYNTTHKLLKIYKQANNIEGIKHQLCKLWYMYSVIDSYYSRPEKMNPISRKLNQKKIEESIKAKAFIMNDFTNYLKWIIEREKDFNFEMYFNKTEYYQDIMKVNTKGVKALLKTIIL